MTAPNSIEATARSIGPDEAAYLLVGHGTRNVAGQKQFLTVYQQFTQYLAPKLTGCAFLELAEPSIDQAVEQLARRGIKSIVTVPLLLFAAGHALQDIPAAVATAAGAYDMKVVGQTAPLELNPAIVDLSALRFRQAVCQAVLEPSCEEWCAGSRCKDVALAMIGRGSRSETAAERMRQFSALRRQITPVAELVTGFVYAQTPSVAEVLEMLSRSRCQTVVVQPHLLFEGELIEQLRQQVAAVQVESPTRRWVVAPVLGTDFALARTLAKLIEGPLRCI